MIFVVGLLFLAAVAFAAYQLAEARRWRQAATEAREQQAIQNAEFDATKRALIQQQAESAKHKEIAEVQVKLLTHTQQQLDEKL